MYKNFIAIHLNKFKTIDEFNKLLEDNHLQNINPEVLFNIKSDGYTKVFLDQQTQEVIGFAHKSLKGQIKFCDELISHLKNVKSIDFKRETLSDSHKSQEPSSEIELNSENLSIDSILDKINLSGMNSLNSFEKEFLRKNSNS